MAKPLSARIAERATKKKPSVKTQNLAVVLALRSEIREAIDDGWPVKTIWETLHEEGKVPFSYQAFRGHVNRLILAQPGSQALGEGQGVKTARQALANTPAKPGDTPAPAPTPAAPQPPAAITGFTFTSQPDKKELL